MCSRKRKFEEDERQSIPNVLQGEVARLDPKFLVNLDPSHCSNNGTVHLICKLGEYRGGQGWRGVTQHCSPRAPPLPQAMGMLRTQSFPASPRNWPSPGLCTPSRHVPASHRHSGLPQSFCPSQELACVVLLDPHTPGPRTSTKGWTVSPALLPLPCAPGRPLLPVQVWLCLPEALGRLGNQESE